jgi:hypothetical protein
MKDLTKEWIKKSEGDVGTAVRESSVKEGANWDAVDRETIFKNT